MKRFGSAILAGLFFVPQAAFAQAAPPPAQVSPAPAPTSLVKATLANGMHVILLPNTLAPVAMTLMSYGVGSADDTLPGIAHATEHMLFRGTTDVSGGQLADIAARMGAEYNAVTADQETLYYYKLPSSYVDVALHIEADRMNHAAMRAADWATERGAIEQEIRAHESQPIYAIGQKLRQTFFAGTPFATASGGTVPSFERMTSADISAFYHAWYHPSNATLIVAGDIDPAKTLAEVHRQFDAVPDVPIPARPPIVVPALESSTVEASVDYPIGFGGLEYRLPGSTAPDYAAAEVLGNVFNSSRGALVDLAAQGKALAAISLMNAFPELGAEFLLAIPARGSSAQSAQSLLGGIIDAYRKDGVPVELVDAAKQRLLSQQVYRQSSISGLGLEWAEANALQRTPEGTYAQIAAVTGDDVNRLLRTYYTDDHRVGIVISPNPSSTMPKVEPGAGAEHVGFVPKVHEPLPAWAQTALSAPLHAPVDGVATLQRSLPNGLTYSMRRETTAPTVVVSGVIRTSPQLYAPAGKDGVAMLLEHMMGWGTTTYDRKAYEAQLDAIAATAKLGTSFTLQVQSKDFERGMQLLADGLLHPAFGADAFTVSKASTLQVVGISNTLPKTKADLAQRLLLYPPGDPRRRDVTEQTVSSLTLEDAKRYYAISYRPDETTLAVVGDVSPERVAKAVRAAFGAWTSHGPAPTFRFPKLKPLAKTAQTVTVKSHSNVQSEVTLSQVFTMRRTDADYVPLLLANTILSGEGTGSLLMEELRTHRGYVYTADSDFHVDRNGGAFSVSFASDPKGVTRANAAVVAIVKRLQSHPLPVVELQRAKALLLARRILPLDSYTGVADDMLSGAKDGYVTGGSDSWFWNALLRTTPAQMQHALRRIDADRFVRTIIEPDT